MRVCVCVRVIYERLNQENGKRNVAVFCRYSVDKTLTKPKIIRFFKSAFRTVLTTKILLSNIIGRFLDFKFQLK